MKKSATRAFLLVACASLVATACTRGGSSGPTQGDAQTSAPPPSADLAVLARAEDQRRSKDVPEDDEKSHDVRVRRRAARALARIADAPAGERLLADLSDEDPEVVAWSAYGLGYACKGVEGPRVLALVARATSLAGMPTEDDSKASRASVDPRLAIARAIARCGGPLAESVLASWVRRAKGTSRPMAERAAIALGDLASRKKDLGDDALLALLDAAHGDSDSPPIAIALYGVGRAASKEPYFARVFEAAKPLLDHPSSDRIFAVKALSRAGKLGAPELARVVSDPSFSTAERAEAARGLGALGDTGKNAIADLLAPLTPDKDPFAMQKLGGDVFEVLRTLIEALGDDAPKKAETPLFAIASLEMPEPPPMLARRIASLRCAAAGALSKGAYDADVMVKCAPQNSEAWESARLASLVKRPINTNERKNVWRALAKSDHVRVREAALEAIESHAELGDAAAKALADALAAKEPGLVATAAEAIEAHPERVFVLADSEKRAALDPRAPPPSQNPARETDRDVTKAVEAALKKTWAPDLFETRLALMDAAVAIRSPSAHATADAACHDSNVTMRDRGAKALRAFGETNPECTPPDTPSPPAAEIAGPPAHATKLTLATDAGKLILHLEPELAPITVARVTALAKSGFYKGIVVHRVVPGFVAQFGDPGGDGYGGSGTPLRCETSPVPFEPLDIGVALAGRDTGSSQLFVTLSRTPHLDGEYTRLGRAEGDWDALAEGDVITDVTVEDE